MSDFDNNFGDDEGIVNSSQHLQLGWIGGFFAFLFFIIMLGLTIFLLYVYIAIIAPWLISAMMAAGLSHAAALFIVLLHTMGFVALMFLGIVAVINLIRQKNTIAGYRQRRVTSLKVLVFFALTNLILTGFTLVGTGVGIYLSVLIMPSVVAAIVATGVSLPLAIFAAVFLSFNLIALSVMFFMAPTWLGWRLLAIPKWRDIAENPMQMLPFLGMLAGLGLGVYLTTLLYPVLMTALTALALPHAAVVLASLIIVFELIFASSFLVFGGTTGLAHLFGWMHRGTERVTMSLRKVSYEETPLDSASIMANYAQYHHPSRGVGRGTQRQQGVFGLVDLDTLSSLPRGFQAFTGEGHSLGDTHSAYRPVSLVNGGEGQE